MSDPTGKDLAKAQAVIKELLNPEPHPFQKEWSEAHSMSIEQLINRICDALATERAEAISKTKEIAAKNIDVWANRSHACLMAGEMSLAEFRSVKAVVESLARIVRALTDQEIMGKEKAR